MSFFMYQTTIPNKKKTPIKPPLSPIRPLLWRGCNQKHTSPKDFFRKAKLIDGKTHLKLYNSLSLVPVLLLASSIPLYAYVLQISQNNNELQQKLLRHEVHEKFSGWNKGEFVILIFNICLINKNIQHMLFSGKGQWIQPHIHANTLTFTSWLLLCQDPPTQKKDITFKFTMEDFMKVVSSCQMNELSCCHTILNN